MIKKLAILTVSAAVLAGCSGDGENTGFESGRANRFAGEYTGTYVVPGVRGETKNLNATIHSDGTIRGTVNGGQGSFTGNLNHTTGAYTLKVRLPNLAPFTDTGTLTLRPDGSVAGAGTATPVAGQGAKQTEIDLG